MRPGSNHFVLLKKTIAANRLGFTYKPTEVKAAAPAVSAQVSVQQSKALEKKLTQNIKRQFEKEFRNHVAHLLKEQRLRILTLNSKRKQELQQLQLNHQQRLSEYKQHNDELQQELRQYIARNQELKETIEGQAIKIEGVREYFEHKLKAVAQDEGENIQSIKANYEAEMQAKIEAATLEINEKLQMRDVELMYRNEQEKSLSQEIHRLRKENQLLLNNSSEQLLEKLEKAGLNFVAYHPGAGHLTIPLADMGRYLENATAYAAEKCGVSLIHYKEWLDHYKSPSCQALKERGELCGVLIERVPTPSHFHTGESDRCDTHKTTPTQSFAALRM
jgi:DNA repair exonuclease SbcCD ATPase subunit